MLKGFSFVSLFCLFSFLAYAQDDYVIDANDLDKPVIKKSISDVPNPDYTSYFTSPTAFTLSSRDFRLASNDIIFFKCSYGISSKTTLTANMSLFGSLIASVKQQIHEGENHTVSFTASMGDFTASIRDTTIFFTGASAQLTFGDYQRNFTIGTGFHYVYSNIDVVNENNEFYFHTINAGYQNQLNKYLYLIVDGYYFTNYNLFSGGAGLKFIIKRKYSLNVGVMPLLFNDVRSSRYQVSGGVIPFFAVRMLIARN